MIYICIPAHNEERTVGVLLWKIRQVMANFPRDYQILVANDGSSDATADVLAPYQRVLPLTVFHLERRRGYASALELLIREAVRRADYPKRDVIITLQADLTDDPDELLGMLKRIEAGADIVAANAELSAAMPRAIRWPRQLGNKLLRGRGWPDGVSDPLCGLRAYRLMVIKRAIETRGQDRLLTWDGWPANAELLQLAQPHSRRTEGMTYVFRMDRQQRPSRHALFGLLGDVIRYARGSRGPLASVPLTLAPTAEPREARKAARPETRPEPEPVERSRPERTRASRNGQDPRARRKGSSDRKRTRDQQPRAKREAAKGADGNGAVPPVAEEPSRPELDAGVVRTGKRRRKRRRGKRPEANGAARNGPETEAVGSDGPLPDGVPEATYPQAEGEGPEGAIDAAGEASAAQQPGRRRRSRRGGRGRRGRGRARETQNGSTTEGGAGEPNEAPSAGAPAEPPVQRSFDSDEASGL